MEIPIKEINRSKNSLSLDKKEMLAHLHSMIDKIIKFLDEDRRDKLFRWLGFIQGALWVLGIYTINELKNHNRPDQ